ncbi:MAG: bifunctional UDP-N-acetylglucosamine diphosphorylase/glucosamine-1-phosphate N-acetyltransferase GlmU [Actinomycetota bacterium]
MTTTGKSSDRNGKKLAVIVLAAGESTRFRSKTPKVLHDLCGRPLVMHVLEALKPLKASKTVIVVGRNAEEMKAAFAGERSAGVTFAVQHQRLGTADAAKIGDDALASLNGDVLITPGDTPLLDVDSLRSLVRRHRSTRAAVTMLTASFANPKGYGRILRDDSGSVARIIEDADCSAEQKKITEGNAGVYVFDRAALRSALTRVEAANKQGELYLTDVVEILKDKGERIEAVVAQDEISTRGINDRVQLAEAARIMRARVAERHMREGVTIEDPATTYIDATVRIGRDTVVRPMTFLRGATRIGEGCAIGPEVELVDCRLGDRVTISRAVAKETTLEDGASVGPFASLRAGTTLKRKAKAGTFVETKKTTIGPGSKVPHLSYMGDATIGRDTNIGAGTITSNYDGETKTKSATIIGDEVLVASDTMLIAPVKLGNRAVTGAGSVVTRDVKANEVVVGAPARLRRTRKPTGEKPVKKGSGK